MAEMTEGAVFDNNNVVNIAFLQDEAQIVNLLESMTRKQLVDFAVGEYSL